jgi:hypothetical protein
MDQPNVSYLLGTIDTVTAAKLREWRGVKPVVSIVVGLTVRLVPFVMTPTRPCPDPLHPECSEYYETSAQLHYADLRIMPMWPHECLLMKRFTPDMSA